LWEKPKYHSASGLDDEELPPNLELDSLHPRTDVADPSALGSEVKCRSRLTSQISESGREARQGHSEVFEGNNSVENWLSKPHKHEQLWRTPADGKREGITPARIEASAARSPWSQKGIRMCQIL